MMMLDEVAQYLKLHPLTVCRLASEGEIPAFKVGWQWKVKRELLNRWAEEKSIQGIEV